MDEMVAADGQGIAIAHGHDHPQFGLAQLEPGGKGQGPAVQGVQAVEIHVAGNARRTADARDHDQVFFVQAHAVDRVQQGVEDDAVAAARAPHVREKPLADVVVDSHVTCPSPG